MVDAQGNEITGGTGASVARLDEAMRALTIGHGDALGMLDEMIAQSPDMPLALLTKAWFLAIPLDPKLARMAQALVDRAAEMTMNERERALLGAVKLVLAGERRASVTALDAHLLDYPRDLLAHYAALFGDILLGRGHRMRERVLRAMPFWSPDTPGYAVMLTILGFGLEEGGSYAEAEEQSRAAIAREPYIYLAHHTIAHCMEMTDRPDAGLAFSRERASFWASPESGAQGHVWWHTSLFHIELGQYADALELYDGPLMRTIRPVGFSLSDPAATLWRLDTLGCDVGGRWADLLPRWEDHADGRSTVFTDMHAAMTELRSGREALAEARLGRMRETAAGVGEAAEIYREVGVSLVEALLAFHRGAYGETIEKLFPIRPEVWRIGGSHAQRDIVDWTLTTAALRAGRRSLAQGLVNERMGHRPGSAANRQFSRMADQLAA